MRKAKGRTPGRTPASGPKTARQQENCTKRRGDLSELAFVYKAASLGFGVAKPCGDSERYDVILDSRVARKNSLHQGTARPLIRRCALMRYDAYREAWRFFRKPP